LAAATTTADPTVAPSSSPSLSPTTTAVDTCDADVCCDSFICGADAAHVPSAATVEGNDFATCCRCQFGSNLLWGAHANGTFHGDSNSMEMWLDIPKVVTMEEIEWANKQNDNLGYTRGDETTKWNSEGESLNTLESECRTRWTLAESLDTFFGTGSRFTYHKDEDRLEGIFEFKADRSMSRIVSGHESVYVRHITQDVPVLFSLEKTATVEATFKTSVTALAYDIAITGIAEETQSENGEIVLTFDILSSSCMEKSVTLKTCVEDSTCGGQDVINGGITSTWSDEKLWREGGMSTSSCRQDVTVTFKRKNGEYNLPLVFEFQIQAADDSGEKIYQAVDLHIEEASILDTLPIQTTMSFYLTEERTNRVESFGLGHTVYGRIKTTTVVSVDSIVLSSLVLEQMGYDNEMQTFDIMTLSWAEYQGEYPESSDHFDFSFMLKSTDLHITASNSGSDHLASIEAAIAVTYLDGSTTNDRRQLAIAPANIDGSDASMEAMGSFAITAADEEENVAALLEITSSYKSHFLQLAAAGGFLALFLYCVRRQMKYQHESYSPLLVDDEI